MNEESSERAREMMSRKDDQFLMLKQLQNSGALTALQHRATMKRTVCELESKSQRRSQMRRVGPFKGRSWGQVTHPLRQTKNFNEMNKSEPSLQMVEGKMKDSLVDIKMNKKKYKPLTY